MNLLVNLDVDDLDKAVDFYSAAFGLTVGRRFGYAGVEMLGSTAPIYLLRRAAGSAASTTTTQLRSYQRHWTPVHLNFVVEDIDAAVERATAAGATPHTSCSTSLPTANTSSKTSNTTKF